MSVVVLPTGQPHPQNPPENGAQDIVTAGFATAQDYAREAFNSAIDALEDLSRTGEELTDINIDVASLEVAEFEGILSLPTSPEPDITIENIALPTEPDISGISDVVVDDAPQFEAEPPQINIGAKPSPFSGSVPIAPNLDSVVAPDAPSTTLPEVPTFIGLTIPAAPTLNLPDFSATLAAAPNAPANVFAFVESAYTDSLLESLKTNLETWVNGAATGLDPAVENAIWERGRARENVALARKQRDIYRNFAARGFSKPPGVVSVELDRAAQDSQNTLSDLSRDVMIKQADLEQSNRRFAFEAAIKVEGELLTYNNLIAQRAFEAARYTQQILLDIFAAQVQRFNAQVQAYNTEAQVYKTRIEAELAKLEAYKSELEGQKLIGEMNLQQVEIYKARITAVMSAVEIYKAQVEAANLVLSGNKIRVDAFAAQIGAYDSQVRAKAAEYDGYATSVKAEVAKIEVFRGQAEAYRAQVEGYAATTNAAVAVGNQQVEAAKLGVDLFRARADMYRAQSDAQSSRVQAEAKIFDSKVQAYSAEAQANVGKIASDVQAYRAHVDGLIGSTNANVQIARANVDIAVQKSQLLVESIKAGGQISAQMAAAALSAVNLSAQVSDSVSNSASNNSAYTLNEVLSSQTGDVTYHNLTTE